MSRRELSQSFLGLECGATRTVALAGDSHLNPIHRQEFGPANLKLLDDAALAGRFREIAAVFPQPAAVGIGMAGARTEADRDRIRRVAHEVWGNVPLHVTHDLEIALGAAESQNRAVSQVLVLSGTGSCCYGKAPGGKVAKLGGWGHLLGDKGSGYEIGLRALKAVVFYLDRDGAWSDLGRRVLRRLLLNEPDQLIDWIQNAQKPQIAALAKDVFDSAGTGDEIARDILEGAAHTLAEDGVSCAAKLAKPGQPVTFVLAGSVLVKQSEFARKVAELIEQKWPGAKVETLQREGVWGAVKFAIQAASAPGRPAPARRGKQITPDFVPPLDLTGSPTEQRNPRSMNLDKLSPLEAVRVMLREEARVIPALLKHEKTVAQAVTLITAALKRGGRLFYVGAGTSGRLGVLDASECPPTFRADPKQVQGIIAGGSRALVQAVEGAEDDPIAGLGAIQFRGVAAGDIVVGIAASGRTPFVWGALAEAKRRGAKTILLSFNPSLKIARADRPDLILAIDVGPEVLTGSTRLKSGTATKLVLNLFSTLAMVGQGKVIGNLMVDLNPSNTKLRDRAVRIVQELTGAEAEQAQAALERNGWIVKNAVKLLGRKTPAAAKVSRPAHLRRRNARARSGRSQK